MDSVDKVKTSTSSGRHHLLVFTVATCIVLSLAVLGFVIHIEIRSHTELEEVQHLQARVTTLEHLIKSISKMVAPDIEIDLHSLNKREVGDDDKGHTEMEELLSQLSLGDLSQLRGPAGRDGRDGRDGRNCDPTECSAAALGGAANDGAIQQILSLLSNKTSAHELTTTQSSSSSLIEFNQAELLTAFNETIAHGILRSIQRMNMKIEQLQQDIGSGSQSSDNHQGESEGTTPIPITSTDGGSTYTRWGRTTCTNTSQLIYTGIAAGQHYTHTGGASDYQCLPLQPEYNSYLAGDQGNYIYGAEYETGSNIFGQNLQNLNVPCARCYTPHRTSTIMIPARRSCPDSWTKEYEGYLMSGHYSHQRAYTYSCVDASPESMPGSHGDANGALFYFVQSSCNVGLCPPYIEAAELTCVVCSK